MPSYLIIPGFMRSGTTSAFRYLASTKKFGMAEFKEVNYFIGREFYSEDEYSKLFSSEFKSPVNLDVSPKYARNYQVSAENIGNIQEKKIIFIIRNPVDRAISIYKSTKRSGKICPEVTLYDFACSIKNGNYEGIFSKKSFEHELVKEMNLNYLEVVREFERTCGEKNVSIEFFEIIEANPTNFVNNALSLLDLELVLDLGELEVENKSLDVNSYHLYRFALLLNEKLEPFFNRYPKIRSLFRKLHSLVNGKEDGEDYIEERKILRSLYFHQNLELNEYFSRKGVVNLPKWLKGEIYD